MKRIRYLTLLSLVLCSMIAWADDGDFDPTNPAEPGYTPIPTRLTLMAEPADGGTVTGGGKYAPNTSVQLKASTNTGFRFVNWTNANGTVISTTANFTYTKGKDAETLTAHFEFDPSSPSEPSEIDKQVCHWLTLAAEEGGTVSGGGRYKAYAMTNKKVTVTANASEGFLFAGWYDSEGETLISLSASYQVQMPAEALTLLAKFTFNPSNPSEPDEIKTRYHLNLTAEEGGNVYAGSIAGSTRLTEGESVTIRAEANSGYDFVGWYRNGVLYTESDQFLYEMGNSDVDFEARFVFNPDNPGEPVTPLEKIYAFYLMNVIGKPGDTVKFPIYLTNLLNVRDMDFQLSFPSDLIPMNLDNPQISNNASGYTIEKADGEAEEGFTAYVFTLAGGIIEPGNTALLTFDITIPENMETARAYPITINQITVNSEDSPQTAAAANGRISVYKPGDANGDDIINLTDASWIVRNFVGRTPDGFIPEAANVTNDNSVNLSDAQKVVRIFVGKD